MSSGYDHKSIEKKWQERWEAAQPYRAADESSKPKQYLLIEFPYPSGDGLHVGHIRSWTALDVVARRRRMLGQNVLYPIGWDAFGLPAENYAIKTGIHPSISTKQNTDNFRRQIRSLGISFDWSREVNTTDPGYYKWTQWIFLQLYKHGLAYKAKTLINWCPKDKIGLANEEVVTHSTGSGQAAVCERCGTPVEKREKEQWMLAITKYAQRLYDDLDTVDYIEAAKAGQRNWIGPSEGALLKFQIANSKSQIEVFTTRPDTLFGATYMVLAPEHPLVAGLSVENRAEVDTYVQIARNKSDIERSAEGKEKTGVELKGVKAINPASKEEIPVFIADYVMSGYGTGAIMAVPAHDERDYEFAQKYNLPIREVVVANIIDKRNPPVAGKKVVERNNVHAIVCDPKTGNYLALRWKKFDWTTFPMGGVEEGESIEEAARREVREETGYTNLKLLRVLPDTVRAEYFAAHKDQNRVSYTRAAIFELAGGEREELSAEERENHDIVWLEAGELDYEHMTHAEVEEWKAQLEGRSVYFGPGMLTNSGEFNGMQSEEAKKKIIQFVGGKSTTTYKLRDWVFSRQRYWGEPIPMINCDACGWQPVSEEALPVELPQVEKYQPTDTGESPLAGIAEFVNTSCPKCGGAARRETDVMPNWAGSSWYYIAYTISESLKSQIPISKQISSEEVQNKFKYWLPVDWYNGGMEHTTLHLLYSRFWHKFLFDIGLVPTSEPYSKRTSHGLILAEGGEKMSKSKGNTVSPDELVETYGADALRLYEMFIGPFDQPVAWSTQSISGMRRFLDRVYKLAPSGATMTPELEILLHQTVKKVGDDIENLKMNTAVSALMILLNKLEGDAPRAAYETFVKLLAPFAPHMASELAETHNIALGEWPAYDESKLRSATATVAVQVDGKVRATIDLLAGVSQDEALAAARANPAVAKWLAAGSAGGAGKEKRAVYVPGKIISFSTK